MLESYETSINGFLRRVHKTQTVLSWTEVYQNFRELITAIHNQITPTNCLHSISSRKNTKYSANIAKGLYMGKYPVSTISICVETSVQRRKFSFLRVRCHDNEINTRDFPERKVSQINIIFASITSSRYHGPNI